MDFKALPCLSIRPRKFTTMKTTFYKGFIVNKLFSNYKFASNQKEAFLIDKFSWLLCFCVSMLFNSLICIKIEFESRLHCIDIIAYPCIFSKVRCYPGFFTWNLRKHKMVMWFDILFCRGRIKMSLRFVLTISWAREAGTSFLIS